MIHNKHVVIQKSDLKTYELLPKLLQRRLGENILRWYISEVDEKQIVVETTLTEQDIAKAYVSKSNKCYAKKSIILSVIPTGIGCDIGGYAGDASPITNLLASTVDYLITNPNAVNASNFINMYDNILYTDGATIDLFCQDLAQLHIPYSNKIGLIIEKTDGHKLDIVFNILNATRAIYGINIEDYIITDQLIGSRCVQNKSGAFVGTIDNPEILFKASEKLLAKGVDAIAITTNVQDLPKEIYADHFSGLYPNPVGGVEAIISYLITKKFQVPSAHAPLLNMKQLNLKHKIVDCRGAGEMASISGLACILIGLRRSPLSRPRLHNRITEIININNVIAIVTPASCLGGVPVVYTRKYDIPIIAVSENRTILKVTPEKIKLNNIIEVKNYAETVGVILALKKGIDLKTIYRPLKTLRYY